MNSPPQNRGRLPHYRSQVTTLTTNNSPILLPHNKNYFKHSLVPDLARKHQQMQKIQPGCNLGRKPDQLYSQRNHVKGYEHLLPSKSKNSIKSPPNTYRTRQNFSPRSPRQNIYISDNETELEQNRSVKFISKLRQQINSPLRKYQTLTSNLNLNLKQKGAPYQNYVRSQAQTILQSRVNEEGYSPQIIKLERMQQSEDYMESSQSPQRQTFERKLIDKCKSLQFQVDTKDKQIQSLALKLQTLEHKHNSQMNLLKNQFMLQKSKKESQLQIATKQMQELQKSIKNLQKIKNTKQKALMDEVTRYAKQLKQSEQQRNKMVLEFQGILQQKVERKDRACSEQIKHDIGKFLEENKSLKYQIVQINKQIEEVKQEREHIFEQSKLLNLELQNYTKWNQEQSQEIRVYERKLHQLQSSSKMLDKEKQLFETSIKELQQALTIHQNTIKSMQTAESLLSQEVQILRFEVQSLKNQMQSKQKQLLKEKSMYLEQIEILESKCLCTNREKLQICEQLEYQRKELANMRRLVDSLEERLQEQRRDFQQADIQREGCSLELKQKSQAMCKLMNQMLYKENQVVKYQKKLQQLQDQLKLAKAQNEQSIQIKTKDYPEQEQGRTDRTDCILRIQLLEKQIAQLMARFKEQTQLVARFKSERKSMLKQQQKQKQGLKKKLLQLQKQLFRKEEAYLDDKRRYALQSARHQEKILSLQQSLSAKNKQVKQLQENLTISEVKVKHLIKNFSNLQQDSHRNIYSKQQQLAELKKLLNEQKHKQLQLLLAMIQSAFKQIEKSLQSSQKILIQQQKQNITSYNSLLDENLLLSSTKPNRQQQMVESINSPQSLQELHQQRTQQQQKSYQQTTHQQQEASPFKKNRLQSFKSKFTFMSNLKQLNQHQLSMQFISWTKQITSHINLLNKKVCLYEFTICSLESNIQSQPVKIHQEYMHRIFELQKKMETQQNIMQMERQSFSKDLVQEKQRLGRELQRARRDLSQKEKEVEQLNKTVEYNKKAQQQVEQRIDTIKNQNKRVIKNLTSDIQEYKNLSSLLKEEKQQIQKQNQSLKVRLQPKALNQNHHNPATANNQQNAILINNLSLMTTVNRQNQYPTITNINLKKTPTKSMRTNTCDSPAINASLQDIVEYRLNELTLQNQHLSNQLSSVNSELMKEKEMFIELDYVIKQMQNEIQKISQENQSLKDGYHHFQLREKQLSQELNFLQEQNASLQAQLQSQSEATRQTSAQIELNKNNLLLLQKSKKDLQRQLQNLNKEEAQKYLHTKKLQNDVLMRQKDLQMLKIQKDSQIHNLSQKIEQSQNKYKQEQGKRKILQKVYEQLLHWIEEQPSTLNIKNTLTHKQSQTKESPLYTNSFSSFSLNQYQRQTIASLSSSFTSRLENLQHTAQEFQKINQGLKMQIQRQMSLTDQKQLQNMRKQRQLQTAKDRISALQRTIQKLEIQIQEWKFICESNSLNKSLTLQQKWLKESLNHQGNYRSSAFNKPTVDSHQVIQPQKGTSKSQTKYHPSPIKSPSKVKTYQSQLFPNTSTHNNPNLNGPQNKSYQINMQNSVDSISSVGQFYEYQKGNNLCNSSGEMSFF